MLALPAFAAGTALHVTVSFGLAAENYQRAFSGRFVKLTAGTNQGLTGKELGSVTAGAVVFMEPVASVNPRTASDLIADLTGRIASNISGMTASMVAAMRTQNAATGVLEWKQDVLLPNSQRGVLAWRMMVDSGGSARYGAPEVLPAEVLTLDVVYTPLNLSAILPPSWPRYADAGLLKWRLIDRNGTARTAWVTVDAAGAFDDPESTATENVDPDAGLKCLILDRTRCGGPTDVKTLMDQQGAAGAYVAYTRRLTPLYDNVADPARPGEFIQQPRISLTIDNRELRYNGCGQNLTYRNQGAYGYTLAAHAEKYLVDASLRYYPVDWSDQVRTSPTQPYDKSVAVARSYVASIGSLIISPGPTGSELVNSGDVAGITYLAPVVQSGQQSQDVTWGWTSGVYSHAHSAFSGYKITCDEDRNKIRVLVGEFSGMAPEIYAEFTPGVAGAMDSVTFGSGDLYVWGSELGITVYYDGNRTFRFKQSTTPRNSRIGGSSVATSAANNFPYVLQNVFGTLIYADGVACRPGEYLLNQPGSLYACASNAAPGWWSVTCPTGYTYQPGQCYGEYGGCDAPACSRPALDETIVW
ncbi:MAG: hypothetical protein PHD37_06570 [Gallionellaceae bacterium]|nr:hypothetical protein [Gallionellaceae bacterium]